MEDTLIFDTDIFIWVERGNQKAANIMNHVSHRRISIQTYMELLQRAQNKEQHKKTKQLLTALDFHILPFTENIGHRAAIYIEEFALSSGMGAGDAIIAATAVENDLPLVTGNKKHFIQVTELQLKLFTP